MRHKGTRPSRALLFHLEPKLESDLQAALSGLGVPLITDSYCSDDAKSLLDHAGEHEVIFCPADSELLHLLQDRKPPVPVVAVSRIPETGELLNAMEAGAYDYCAPPFEPGHLRWILKGASSKPSRAA